MQKSIRCPTCNKWIWVDENGVDFMHKCVKTDGSAYVSRKKKYHPGRVLQRIDEPEYPNIGNNPCSPDKRLTRSQLEKQVRGAEQQVYTDIKIKGARGCR